MSRGRQDGYRYGVANPAHPFSRCLGRRYVLCPPSAAACRRDARAGSAPHAVVTCPRPILRLGVRGDRAASADRVYDGLRRLCRVRDVGLHIHLMQGIGILIVLLFLHLYFAPWRRFRTAVARQDWAEGGRQLAQIRMIVTVNLVLGIIVVAIGSSGRYWG